MEKIIIVGAGLCGTLLGLKMAQRGYEVSVYEKRPDQRKKDFLGGRSINLALSNRGLQALEMVGIKNEILVDCIPMHGRMIHPIEGESWLSPYSGRKGDYINSVSREELNMALLEAADRFDNLTVHFDAKVSSVDIEKGLIEYKDASGSIIIDTAAVVIGTDGAGSIVRRSLMGQTTKLLFNYSQDFLRHGYKELSIAPLKNGEFKILKNALHIWPRGQFMIIALPNLDGSFTVTMFHPFEGEFGFNQLDNEDSLEHCFKKFYPELLELIPNYKEEYKSNPVGTLGTIKCLPWHAYGKTLIMGDAAHAIVPFYGQGMNASFEDVFVFNQVLDEYKDDWKTIFEVFEERRKKNSDAIADLAIDNFYEMRDHVDDQAFKDKRKLEMQLEQKFEQYYSKYSMVTFREDISYADAKNMGRKQDQLLLNICKSDKHEILSLDEINQQVNQLL